MSENLLPSVELPKDTVEVAGTVVKIRSLSRAEVLHLQSVYKDDLENAENYILACGVGVTMDEAQIWRASIDVNTGGKVVDAIILLTGLAGSESSKA